MTTLQDVTATPAPAGLLAEIVKPTGPTRHTVDTERCTTFDHARGYGGCWISPAGEFVHVYYFARHSSTAEQLGIGDHSGGYRAGWIRVSLDYGRDDGETRFTFCEKQTTEAAMRSLRSILKTVEALCPSFCGFEDDDGDSNYGNHPTAQTFAGFSTWLTKAILAKGRKARAAARGETAGRLPARAEGAVGAP